VRNLIHENANLSDFKHNPQSYRYGVIDVPGDSHGEIMDKYNDVVSMLGYKFSDRLEPRTEQADESMKKPPGQVKGGSHEPESQPE